MAAPRVYVPLDDELHQALSSIARSTGKLLTTVVQNLLVAAKPWLKDYAAILAQCAQRPATLQAAFDLGFASVRSQVVASMKDRPAGWPENTTPEARDAQNAENIRQMIKAKEPA